MGALDGVRVIELAGIGPGPFCGMMLADQGAEGAGMVFEGFRPGVAERLGVGPDDCLARNPAIVYGRMTGWGQDGPYSSMAGHDINYIALAGVLAHIGRSDSGPVPPMNLVGDFGGGGMYLAYGMVCALLEARDSGKGQVVDAAMVDGAASLMSFIHGMLASGFHSPERGTNLLDTGAHFYDVYECADGGWISLGSIEPQFYAELLDKLGLDAERFGKQNDRDLWPELSEEIAAVVRMKTRDEWDAILEGSDVCYAPVLTVDEAIRHPHNVARGTFIDVGGITQPGPAPRLSRTPGEVRRPPAHAGQHTDEVLSEAGFDDDEVAALRASGAVA